VKQDLAGCRIDSMSFAPLLAHAGRFVRPRRIYASNAELENSPARLVVVLAYISAR
jgi:hypothetical protein